MTKTAMRKIRPGLVLMMVILVIDKNNDGYINDGGELFGDNYVLSNGQTATTGFSALADLDSNANGQIDSTDTLYSSIKVLKGDGHFCLLQKQAYNPSIFHIPKLKQQIQTAILSLDLEITPKRTEQQVLLPIMPLSKMQCIPFQHNIVDVSPEIEALPDASGYGTVDSLHQVWQKIQAEFCKNWSNLCGRNRFHTKKRNSSRYYLQMDRC
jgi:hypothetical protein